MLNAEVIHSFYDRKSELMAWDIENRKLILHQGLHNIENNLNSLAPRLFQSIKDSQRSISNSKTSSNLQSQGTAAANLLGTLLGAISTPASRFETQTEVGIPDFLNIAGSVLQNGVFSAGLLIGAKNNRIPSCNKGQIQGFWNAFREIIDIESSYTGYSSINYRSDDNATNLLDSYQLYGINNASGYKLNRLDNYGSLIEDDWSRIQFLENTNQKAVQTIELLAMIRTSYKCLLDESLVASYTFNQYLQLIEENSILRIHLADELKKLNVISKTLY